MSKQRLQRIWLDGSGYLSRGIENKPRNLDRRGMYREVLRSYQGGVVLLSGSLKWGFQGGEATQDECKQDTHQNKKSKSMLSIKTQP